MHHIGKHQLHSNPERDYERSSSSSRSKEFFECLAILMGAPRSTYNWSVSHFIEWNNHLFLEYILCIQTLRIRFTWPNKPVWGFVRHLPLVRLPNLTCLTVCGFPDSGTVPHHFWWKNLLSEYKKNVSMITGAKVQVGLFQWEFQDPKVEVLCYTRPYFLGIFPYIGLKNTPYIW